MDICDLNWVVEGLILGYDIVWGTVFKYVIAWFYVSQMKQVLVFTLPDC